MKRLNNMHIMGIANCGLLIQSAQTKLLIDGIYQLDAAQDAAAAAAQPADLFSAVSDAVKAQILTGAGLFKDTEFLLFTHCHSDHFNAENTIACMDNSPVRGVFLPEAPESLPVKRQAEKLGVGYIGMQSPFGVMEEVQCKDIRVRFFKTRHYGKGFSQVPHYCFLIGAGDETVYISADADFMDDYQITMLDTIPVSAGFFNPLYITHKEGRELIGRMNLQKLLMYHVPFKKDDRYGFLKLALRNIRMHSDVLPPYEILSEELQAFNNR
jgi:L-ascorbate metabolism protein UlaG (beta-lactamase superfamily)